MKSLTILLLAAVSSISLAQTTPESKPQAPAAITCEMFALGKIDGTDRPATTLLATATASVDLISGTKMLAKSVTGLTAFSVTLTSNSTLLQIFDNKLYPLASTFIKSPANFKLVLFAQLEGMNTPDGHVILNCSRKK